MVINDDKRWFNVCHGEFFIMEPESIDIIENIEKVKIGISNFNEILVSL